MGESAGIRPVYARMGKEVPRVTMVAKRKKALWIHTLHFHQLLRAKIMAMLAQGTQRAPIMLAWSPPVAP